MPITRSVSSTMNRSAAAILFAAAAITLITPPGRTCDVATGSLCQYLHDRTQCGRRRIGHNAGGGVGGGVTPCMRDVRCISTSGSPQVPRGMWTFHRPAMGSGALRGRGGDSPTSTEGAATLGSADGACGERPKFVPCSDASQRSRPSGRKLEPSQQAQTASAAPQAHWRPVPRLFGPRHPGWARFRSIRNLCAIPMGPDCASPAPQSVPESKGPPAPRASPPKPGSSGKMSGIPVRGDDGHKRGSYVL